MFTRARWRIVLPVIMATLSVSLMILTKLQQPTLSGRGTGWEVPPRVMNSVINGPSFYFGRWIPVPVPHALNSAFGYDGDRLLGIVLFWFFIGLCIERHRNKKALDTRYPTRAGVLFAFAALCFGAMSFGGFSYVFCPSPNLSCSEQVQNAGVVLTVALKYPLRTTATMVMSTTVWSLGFCLYFIRRAFAAFRKPVASCEEAPTA
jgi:hypothetical protein